VIFRMREIIITGKTPEEPPAVKRYTYEEYLKLDDGNRYELIEGELVLTPSPGFKHQRTVAAIERALTTFVEEHDLGMVIVAPYDVVLDEGVVLQPDILFVTREKFHLLTEACLKGVPDLVVEVISPSSAGRDRIKKSRLYRRYGVRELWLVDPEARTAEVLTTGENGWYQAAACDEEDILTSPLLPGLKINLKEIFALPEGISL